MHGLPVFLIAEAFLTCTHFVLSKNKNKSYGRTARLTASDLCQTLGQTTPVTQSIMLRHTCNKNRGMHGLPIFLIAEAPIPKTKQELRGGRYRTCIGQNN